jgi:cyclase
LLSKGHSIVKGSNFENQRVVGTLNSSLTVQADRNVDEVMLIDVQSNLELRVQASVRNADTVSDFLRIPFSIGGGFRTIEQIRLAFRHGADKVLLGHSATHTPNLIAECSEEFGSQAICVALDFQEDDISSLRDCCADAMGVSRNVQEFVAAIEGQGAGELLITVRSLDGTLKGPAFGIADELVRLSKLPIVYSGGVGRLDDFYLLAKVGVSGIATGAFFQFSQFSPSDVKECLSSHGFSVRD